MSGNTFGAVFKVTTFGESHGPALGVVIDGVPAGLAIDPAVLQRELDRRKPGNGAAGSTLRKEGDLAEILSGVFEGRSTGTPLAILIRNSDQHSSDYAELADVFRPGHADWGYYSKYGIRDYRGGGRSSGRETVARVAAGAVAKMFLAALGVKITAYTLELGGIHAEKFDPAEAERNPFRTPDAESAQKMAAYIEELRRRGDSCGGIVECRITGVPAGWGEPVFDKLDALLAHAVMSIGAVKGFTVGAGFESARTTGSFNNHAPGASGGIRGGISDGDEIIFQAAVKPTPSISMPQKMKCADGSERIVAIKGRHDICIVPRIVPVIEAMAAMTLADCALRQLGAKIN